MKSLTDWQVKGAQTMAEHQAVEQRQTTLLMDIFTQSSLSGVPERALRIYQHNLHMTAARSLSISYPVIQQMVGERAMLILSRRLLAMEKPSTGDWADWGNQLSSLIASSELAYEHPYLVDVAKLEWAVHQAQRQSITTLDRDNLQLLTNEEPQHIYILLQQPLRVIESPFPVLALWQVHRQVNGHDEPSLDALKKIMSDPQQRHFTAVYQHFDNPKVESLDEQTFLWLRGIEQGKDLAHLLDKYPEFDFAKWLSNAVERQWISRIALKR